jgi:hypothetical protein
MKKISISLLLLIFVACIAIAGISSIKKEKKLCGNTGFIPILAAIFQVGQIKF